MALEMDHDLFTKIHNSDGAKFINKMHAHSFSQNIFYGNLRELNESLNLVENIDIGMKLMSQEHQEEGTQVYKEINRLFVWAGGRKNFLMLLYGGVFEAFILTGTFVLQWTRRISPDWYDFAKFISGFITSLVGWYFTHRVIQGKIESKK